MSDFELSAKITYCPPREDGGDSGWCWEVRVNGYPYADEILPEKSRIIAEELVGKYVLEALAIEKELK